MAGRRTHILSGLPSACSSSSSSIHLPARRRRGASIAVRVKGDDGGGGGRRKSKGVLEDLKKRPLLQRSLVLGSMAIVARGGAHVPLPGVDAAVASTSSLQARLAEQNAAVGGWLGGADLPFNVFTVGLGPAINASILVEILGLLYPSFKRMKNDPSGQGAEKLRKILHYLTAAFAVVFSVIQALQAARVSIYGFQTFVLDVLTYSAGSLACYSISNLISNHGLGNGFTVLISLSIIAGYSSTLQKFVAAFAGGLLPMYWASLLFVITVGSIALSVLMTEAAVKLPIKVFSDFGEGDEDVGDDEYHSSENVLLKGEETFIEPGTESIKIQMAPYSTQPILLASMSLILPTFLSVLYPPAGVINTLLAPGAFLRCFVTFVLVVFFNVVDWSGGTYKLNMYLTKTGARIDGLRPGYETIVFIEFISNILRLLGGILLGLLAVFGEVLDAWLLQEVGEALGLSSLLIIVGMINGIKRQIESLLQVPKLKKYISQL